MLFQPYKLYEVKSWGGGDYWWGMKNGIREWGLKGIECKKKKKKKK